MKISVIIPVYNEEKIIAKLVEHLISSGADVVQEILVIDGGSSDETQQCAAIAGAAVHLSPQKGRAAQMHFGATLASGDVLYFVHADTMPPASYTEDICKAINDGYTMGRYRTRFDSGKWLLKINAFITRFDLFLCMGGDQTLFITKELYNLSGGFDTSMQIMEEFEFCRRARKTGKYKILKKEVLISARKYDANSWWQVQRANYSVVKMYKKGAAQEAMVKKYKEMLRYR